MDVHIDAAFVMAAVALVGGIFGMLKIVLRSLEQKVESIRKEVMPNGGESLGDRVVRIEERTKANTDDIRALKERWT